ncbi:MAG: amidohydrolase [Rikenellaceae bacterium]
MSSLLLHSAQILTMVGSEPEILNNAAVGVVGDTITMVTTDNDRVAQFRNDHPSATDIDCGGRLIMPGLINTHGHISMTLQRNLSEDLEVMTWLNDYVWKFEAQQSEDDIEAGALLGIGEMLLGGTTSFVDMYFAEHRVANAAEKLGIRALLTESILDFNKEGFAENWRLLKERVKGSSLIQAGFSPHAPYTCSPETLEYAKKVTEFDPSTPMLTTIHLLESPTEAEMVKEMRGIGAVDYLDGLGLINSGVILDHCIHLDDHDIEVIAARGATISHCPQSNMKLCSGIAPIAKLRDAGVNCTIGTDGVCSNNDLDMWDEMRTVALLQRVATMNPTVISAYEILRMATVNGAKALGFAEGRLGVVAEGALADIIIVDTLRPHFRPRLNIVSSLIYCANASDVTLTIVNGKIVARNGKLQSADIEAICHEVEQRTQRIIDSMS